jgi:hypothetical protein
VRIAATAGDAAAKAPESVMPMEIPSLRRMIPPLFRQ